LSEEPLITKTHDCTAPKQSPVNKKAEMALGRLIRYGFSGFHSRSV